MARPEDHQHLHRHDHDRPEHTACAHAHDHAARAPLALVEAMELCKARGERLTPIRQRVLAALYSTHKPLSAYEVIETLASETDKRLAPVTIYRTMDFLIAQGLAHRLESRNAFIACPARHAPDELVVFMICDSCSGVDEVSSDRLGLALQDLTRQHGFKPQMRIIELAGTCAHCS
ncbi:MAG: Fur family transcriptional regulator [Hyphomicrobiales bacterium]|jgi:Fur family zinc uptake transcriptional regulator|nr:Fur family transcriptional regulator [Hyphomicrobiales bacterium]